METNSELCCVKEGKYKEIIEAILHIAKAIESTWLGPRAVLYYPENCSSLLGFICTHLFGTFLSAAVRTLCCGRQAQEK